MTDFWRVAALPDGGAFGLEHNWSDHTEQVWRVNVKGQVIQHVQQCSWMCKTISKNDYVCTECVNGLIVLNNNIYLIHGNGTLLQININNPNNTVQSYQVPDVGWMVHSGSLSYHPSVITHPDLLLLADWDKSEIFSYNVTSKNKTVHLDGLNEPTSVSFMTYNSHLYYIVCEHDRHQVLVYNSSWGWYKTLGGTRGSGDGQLDWPYTAIGFIDGSVIISDEYNYRVSLFTIQGKFVRHILTWSDGLSDPQAMSISLPYLWVVENSELYRYKLY